MNTRFKTKANRLTPYALSCGYLEVAEFNDIRVTLCAESTSYHVKAYDHINMVRVFWWTFSTLTAERKKYDTYNRSIKS